MTFRKFAVMSRLDQTESERAAFLQSLQLYCFRTCQRAFEKPLLPCHTYMFVPRHLHSIRPSLPRDAFCCCTAKEKLFWYFNQCVWRGIKLPPLFLFTLSSNSLIQPILDFVFVNVLTTLMLEHSRLTQKVLFQPYKTGQTLVSSIWHQTEAQNEMTFLFN